MNEYTVANLKWFFDALDPVKAAYQNPEFSFLLHLGSDGVALVNSRLVFQPLPADQPNRVIEAGNYFGFTGHISSLDVTPGQVVDMLLAGYVPAPDRTWQLTRDSQTQMEPQFVRTYPQPPEHNLQQQIYELHGVGLSIPHWHQTEDNDWSLRAAPIPFSGLSDLLRELRLPYDHNQFHMVAYPPLLVDTSSRVNGEIADLKLRRSRHLPADRVRLGVIVGDRNEIRERRQIPGDQFAWEVSEQSNDVLVGTAQIPAPKASVVHCLAVFDDRCLHHYWAGDPGAHQNPLRTIYEAFDPDFSVAFKNMTQPPKRGQSEAQENAVASLLWTLGFAPIQTGKLAYAPDIIAVSGDGNLIVVECTTSHLQLKENKPQQLLDRTTDIRNALERSDAGHITCIPVMVTSKRRVEVEDDALQCERKGIVVYTYEDIEHVLGQTITVPQSDIRFGELKQRLDQAIERFRNAERKQDEIVRDVEQMKKSFDAISRLDDDFR